LTALRFLIAALLVFVYPRPHIAWRLLIVTGLTLYTGQFLLIFFAMQMGMPPGLASVTPQTQAFFTIALAAAFLRDRPTRRQIAAWSLHLPPLLWWQARPVAMCRVSRSVSRSPQR
jgi:O-acetylserine/cysteine efflux transporter